MWLMLLHHPVERPWHNRHLIGIHALFAVEGSVPGSKQQNIPLPQRNVQSIGHDGKKIPAGNAPPALHKAQMTLRDAGVEREIELALTALLSPVAQQFSELRNCGSRLGCHCDFPLISAGVSEIPWLSSPGELLELIFQRRIGDSSSIVGNRRGR